jgi:hypothetical protein
MGAGHVLEHFVLFRLGDIARVRGDLVANRPNGRFVKRRVYVKRILQRLKVRSLWHEFVGRILRPFTGTQCRAAENTGVGGHVLYQMVRTEHILARIVDAAKGDNRGSLHRA